jgi:hypothetical protein
MNDRKAALVDPVVGLKAPNGRQHRPRYPELPLDPGKDRRMPCEQRPPMRMRSAEIIRPENCSNVWLKTR